MEKQYVEDPKKRETFVIKRPYLKPGLCELGMSYSLTLGGSGAPIIDAKGDDDPFEPV